MSFSHPAAVADYASNVVRQVPGVHALHRMAHLLLAEHVATDGHVLVLGAGGGMELAAFADASPGWRFTGVDPSADMLALAALTLGSSAPRVELIQGYIESVPDVEFDGASCLLTLHFLDREQRLRTLRELRRRLKRGAPFVIAHHSVPDDPAEKRLWFRRWATFASGGSVADADAEVRADLMASRLPRCPPELEVAMLEAAGFERPGLFYAALTFRGWITYAG